MNTLDKIKEEIQAKYPIQDEDKYSAYKANEEKVVSEINTHLENYSKDIENFSDGYHTFNELYEFRKMYNAVLFNEWASQDHLNPNWKHGTNEPIKIPKYNVHKSKYHYDGEACFGGGWFIVIAVLPTGQISNHYEMKEWDLFQIPETPKALFPFDNHSGKDVLDRLEHLTDIRKGAYPTEK